MCSSLTGARVVFSSVLSCFVLEFPLLFNVYALLFIQLIFIFWSTALYMFHFLSLRFLICDFFLSFFSFCAYFTFGISSFFLTAFGSKDFRRLSYAILPRLTFISSTSHPLLNLSPSPPPHSPLPRPISTTTPLRAGLAKKGGSWLAPSWPPPTPFLFSFPSVLFMNIQGREAPAGARDLYDV